jgi:hypothetical protein
MVDALSKPATLAHMIIPTSKFVLLKWVPKGESIAILLPDGARPSTGGDMVVQAVGPEVPQNPPIVKGSKVLLRGDSPPLSGVDEKKKLGMIHCEWIMAVVTDDPETLTDEELDKIAAGYKV